MYALVLDRNKKPLDPTHPAKARKMLKAVSSRKTKKKKSP
ncbi:RRXRR domain-containing protein [Geitlerinema sp. PCC 9228]